MNTDTSLKIIDLVVVICIFILLSSVLVPVLFCSAGRSREALCRNNLKVIGVGVELWKEHIGRYPIWDYPDGTSLRSWHDLLAMQKGYAPDKLEALRLYLVQTYGTGPEGFIKTIDDDKIFCCPGDQSHPHRISKERSSAWGLPFFEYSYGITSSAYNRKLHERTDQQVLIPDGLWPWSQNFSGAWVTDPSASFNNPSWFSNTVGYWHKNNSANFLLMDLHVENHRYPPDTNKVFFLFPGEDINIANYN